MRDRKDGKLIRDIDALHFIMAQIYPNRADNEAFIQERIDLTNINAYLEKKNADNPEYKYNLFQVLATAMLKTVTLRPKMNRFIANKKMYMRNEITTAFVVKKIFADDAPETLAFIHAEDDDNIDTVHDKIYKIVSSCRGEDKGNSSNDAMNILVKIPWFISRFLIRIIRFLDVRGLVPQSIIATDPNYASVMISNLGSIKVKAAYHHLSNWGTTSCFVTIGEKKIRPFFDEEGNVTMKDSVDIGLTIDERIADGYYYSKTIRLLKTLLENPELLETKLSEEIDY